MDQIPCVVDGERDDPVARARARFGRPFAHEPGSDFAYQTGPTVLPRWAAERQLKRDERKEMT